MYSHLDVVFSFVAMAVGLGSNGPKRPLAGGQGCSAEARNASNKVFERYIRGGVSLSVAHFLLGRLERCRLSELFQ